ncbi:PREDICTED: uncharacterized protein LOC104812809 [Tarenaya hassleriana]|uniref:uncharacterized protein LOC104812809 n=1 Tax=Tarenaya hassleriana TaxID=28532 RepID=UPI00053C5E54|nr:PREDICTED: uncharacterized protein LOC104812809 [Tarenaya hassleriana]
MSAPPPASQSLCCFSPATLPTSAATDLEPKLGGEVNRSSSPVPAIANRGVGSRSTRQQRISFSSLAPSSAKPVIESQKGFGNATAREEKPPPSPQRGEVPLVCGKEDEEEEEEEEEEEKRTWNLRPRRSCAGSKRSNGKFSPEPRGGASDVKRQKTVGQEPKSQRQRGLPAESPGLGGGDGRNGDLRLWVSLSRDEIEEDIFSMSGNRPSRRPRKRPKTLQKYIDVVYPGLCLVGLNADCFRTTNSQAKGR